MHVLGEPGDVVHSVLTCSRRSRRMLGCAWSTSLAARACACWVEISMLEYHWLRKSSERILAQRGTTTPCEGREGCFVVRSGW